MDAAGNAIATWIRNEGAAAVWSRRPCGRQGAAFTVLGNLSPAGGDRGKPDDRRHQRRLGDDRLAARRVQPKVLADGRPAPAGAFSKPLNISSGKDNPLFPEIASNDEGDAIVVWNGDNGANEIARAAVRAPGGGAFGGPGGDLPGERRPPPPEPAIDAGGNATVVWVRDNGAHSIVQWAGYDADPPELRGRLDPRPAKVGDAAPVLGLGARRLAGRPAELRLRRRRQASGGTSVSHAYSAPGTYGVRVTVTDAVGKDGEQRRDDPRQGPELLHDRKAQEEPQEGARRR